MRAANGDGVLEPHDLGQHFGAAHHRQAPGASRSQFRIALLDGRGDHHHGRIAQIVAGLADGHLDAHLAQALHVGVFGAVRTADLVALVVQDFGNAAHPDAPDADKVHRTDIARHFHTLFPPDGEAFCHVGECFDRLRLPERFSRDGSPLQRLRLTEK